MAGLDKNIWLIANWKSNKTISEARDWILKVGPQIPKKENLKVVVCPTFSCLSEIKKIISVNNFSIMVGSQDLSPFGSGAYTGEESASLINQLVDLSIIGHSERRQNFGESDEMVAKKVEQANLNKIIPLVCIQAEDTPVPPDCQLIAYEPVFAIGTGNPDTPENANQVAGKFSQGLIYGGSVNSENIASFISQQNINGALIGGASLDAGEFIKIIKICEGLN